MPWPLEHCNGHVTGTRRCAENLAQFIPQAGTQGCADKGYYHCELARGSSSPPGLLEGVADAHASLLRGEHVGKVAA